MKKILCDNCDNDLSESDGITKYRLHLSCERAPHTGGMVLDVYIYPILEEDKHFCGFVCLKKWIEKQGK